VLGLHLMLKVQDPIIIDLCVSMVLMHAGH
jgi:hypothetical protein